MDVATLSIAVDSRQAKDADSALGKLMQTGSSLEGMIRKVAAAWASWEIFKQIRDISLLAARYETLGIAMNTAGLNIGYTSIQMAALQSAMEKTGISMTAARQSLTMMAVAQMDMSRSTELARVAQNAAIVANMNSSEAFETLTRSIQTGMAVTAHHMGMMVNYDQAEKRLADSLGKTKEQLTDREKIQARMNEALRVGAGFEGLYEASMTTAGKQLKSMERYVENLEAKMGSLFGPALSAGVTFFTNTLKEMNDWMDRASKNGSLKKIADSLGAFTGGALEAAIAPIRLMIEYSEQLKVATLGIGIAAMFAYGNQWVPALASAIAPTVRMLSLTVALELSTIRYATGAGLASLATAGWSAAMTAALSPMGLVAIALGALYLATKSLREETEKLNEENARKEKFAANVTDPVLNMRLDAIRLRKQREALLADGGTPGAHTRQFQIDELVKGVTKDKEDQFTPDWLDAAKRYATQTVDNRKALDDTKTAIEREQKARDDAKKSAEEYGKTITSMNQALGLERVTLEQGDRAAYAYGMTIKGVKAADQEALLVKWDYNKAIKEQSDLVKWEIDQSARATAERIKGSEAMARDNQALQQFVTELDPAKAAAEKWARVQNDLWYALDAEIIPSQAEYNRLLKIAEGQYTEAGQAAEAYQKKIQGDVTRMNRSKGGKDEFQYLTDLGAAGLDVDLLRQHMEKFRAEQLRLRAEAGDTWAIIGYTVTQNAGRATDALADWMDNTDGLGRSWTTLGNTVRNVIADMLRQMERAIIQQKLMDPLFKGFGAAMNTMGDGGGWASFASAFGSAFGGGKASGGDVYGGTSYLVGERGPEIFTPGVTGTITPNHALGGTVINSPVNISVKVESSGQVSSQASGAAAADLARRVAEGVVNQWASEQMRSGGILARA